MKFLDFMDKRTDPFIQLTLADLARTLAHDNKLRVDFSFHSYCQKQAARITISHYWAKLPDEARIDGMKSDVYLRAFGNMHFTDMNSLWAFAAGLNGARLPSFLKQVFCLLEDWRLESLCTAKRPGMAEAFHFRYSAFHRRFRERFGFHKSREDWADMIFCAVYLQLIGRPVAFPAALANIKPAIRQTANAASALRTTQDAAELAISLSNALCKYKTIIRDMSAGYFTFADHSPADPSSALAVVRPPLSSTSSENVKNKEEKQAAAEKMPARQREQKQSGDNFLQFDLTKGKKTNLVGGEPSSLETSGQVSANARGSALDTDRKDYGNEPEQAGIRTSPFKKKASGKTFGEPGTLHRFAKAVPRRPRKPSSDEQKNYQAMASAVSPIQKRLERTIQKTIEQKQNEPMSDLLFGRLSRRRLLSLFTNEQPRLFYKKNVNFSRLPDAAFSLLVDCSASMADKIDETKAGLILFHETLRRLKLPHTVTGFWEDAICADKDLQTNILFQVIAFSESLTKNSGRTILQLQPEEDNRDGFVIRLAARDLLKRDEKRKVMIIFTDGEPSAYGYTDNAAIIDTYNAVSRARKQGIEVIGIFLSNGEQQDKEKQTMKMIYGRECLIIPRIADIPYTLSPLLKKVLLLS